MKTRELDQQQIVEVVSGSPAEGQIVEVASESAAEEQIVGVAPAEEQMVRTMR